MTDGMPDPTNLLVVPLKADEERLLLEGLLQWGGPALPSDALAVAMGFTDLADFRTEGSRFEEEIRSGRGLNRKDWTRALFMTEVVYASAIVGAGLEWRTVTGLQDKHTLLVLRRLQRKLATAHAILYPGHPGGPISYAPADDEKA